MKKSHLKPSLAKGSVAYISSYPPRECGIATFTRDLIDSIDEHKELGSSKVIAINEKGTLYDYEKRVKWQIERDSIDDYLQVADRINSSSIDLVNLQHEFGLFGGEFGEHLNYFMDNVEKPVVTTLHTIQSRFEPKALAVLRNIASRSAAIVVIANVALKILGDQGISCRRAHVIPHGCPDIRFVSSEDVKNSLGLKDRFVLSTFGLISRGKGIEYAIRALPSVIEREPRIIYLIIGETHPEVRKIEGERYRNKLMKLVEELQLESHVRFHNRFLSKREVIKYLQATDVYLTPYISPNQISSGTLVYALGTGRAVISTPYLQAIETLAQGRGLLCKFRNPHSIAESIEKLLDGHLRKTIEEKVYRYSRKFIWPDVAKKYIQLFKSLIKD